MMTVKSLIFLSSVEAAGLSVLLVHSSLSMQLKGMFWKSSVYSRSLIARTIIWAVAAALLLVL